jgi:GH15 family glucan-1,4-alpha-glucosidase
MSTPAAAATRARRRQLRCGGAFWRGVRAVRSRRALKTLCSQSQVASSLRQSLGDGLPSCRSRARRSAALLAKRRLGLPDSDRLDASLLMLPLVGFLPASDPRIAATVDAIQRRLTRDGFVSRYRTDPDVDGLPPGEASFLLCSFWLVDNLALAGRHDEARRLFERLLSVRNDVGLLAEGYDTGRQRQAGNFPQAFSHVGLINSALNLSRSRASAVERSEE